MLFLKFVNVNNTYIFVTVVVFGTCILWDYCMPEFSTHILSFLKS